MEPETKKPKVFRPPPRRTAPKSAEKKDPAVSTSIIKPAVNVSQTEGVIDLKIRQARDHAVGQAQLDRCKAHFKVFDSQFGNFLVPVIPSRAELASWSRQDMDSAGTYEQTLAEQHAEKLGNVSGPQRDES